ncbi:MAG: NAD(P)/FAD-dependent oxidoreductase, partial [Acidimicrobiia bacterium]|nr:NAD(P)/FAD-dependent oxidoreductase [Acidimicrobiia bacterium]
FDDDLQQEWVWSERYATQPEILEYANHVADRFDMRRDITFNTRVMSAHYDEAAGHWQVRTDGGETVTAQFCIMATGCLSSTNTPNFNGIADFRGETYHTGKWPHEGVDFGNKRVGIIGTGATAVQCVPHLARSAGELFVFQRTPSSIDIRNNHDIDPAWFGELEPGWQDQWLMNFTTLQTGGFADEDLVKDGWTDLSQRIRDRMVEMVNDDPSAFSREAFLAAYRDCDDEKMEEIRARVDSLVADDATADALKPWYRQLCKRPCFHDEYLQSYNNPNTHLIDTDGKGVTEITPTGVVVGDTHYELDCLVFASGFEVGTTYARRSGFETTGRDGLTLTEHWAADGMRSLHGRNVHGFPNLFVVGFSQAANLISNVPHNLVEAGRTVAAMVKHAVEVGADEVEVTAEAEQAWIDRLKAGDRRFAADPDCTPGYYNNEGQPDDTASQIGGLGFPEGPVAYFQYIDAWRSSGQFAGLEFR